MPQRNTTTHPLPGPGTATWFGDSLPGALSINGATTTGRPYAATAGGAHRG